MYGKKRPIAILWYQISIPLAFFFKFKERLQQQPPSLSSVIINSLWDEGYRTQSFFNDANIKSKLFPTENGFKRVVLYFFPFKIELTRLQTSKNRFDSTTVKNALWEIMGSSVENKKQHGNKRDDKSKEQDEANEGYIMISYNWTHQKLALSLRDGLKEAGYRVWIDVDKMSMYPGQRLCV